MTDLQGWQKVAREIGDYDLGWCIRNQHLKTILVQRGDHETVGDWLPAEAAAKEILRLREMVEQLEAAADKRASRDGKEADVPAAICEWCDRFVEPDEIVETEAGMVCDDCACELADELHDGKETDR